MGPSYGRESPHYGLLLLLLLALIAYAAIGLTLKVESASQDHVDGGSTTPVDRHAPPSAGESLQKALKSAAASSP
jgi:hypothetical protein